MTRKGCPKLQQSGTAFLLWTKLTGAITAGQSNIMLYPLECFFTVVYYRVLYTYAPFADQPKLDRTADEIPEVCKTCLYTVYSHIGVAFFMA